MRSLLIILSILKMGVAFSQSNLPACQGNNSSSWNNCLGTKTSPNGGEYIGEFRDGKYNGQGTYNISNGSKYIGEFKDGKYNGNGTLTYSNGDKFVGEYKDNKRNGQGTLTTANGDKFLNNYEDGKRTGLGTAIFVNGSKYVGEFKDDKRNGAGEFTFQNGNIFKGNFVDNNFDGAGLLQDKYGLVLQKGTWTNGKFNDSETPETLKDPRNAEITLISIDEINLNQFNKIHDFLTIGHHDANATITKDPKLRETYQKQMASIKKFAINSFLKQREIGNFNKSREDHITVYFLGLGKLDFGNSADQAGREIVGGYTRKAPEFCTINFRVMNKLGFDLHSNAIDINLKSGNRDENYRLINFGLLKNNSYIDTALISKRDCKFFKHNDYSLPFDTIDNVTFADEDMAIKDGVKSSNIFKAGGGPSSFDYKIKFSTNIDYLIKLQDPVFRAAENNRKNNKKICVDSCQKILESCVMQYKSAANEVCGMPNSRCLTSCGCQGFNCN